MEEYLRLFSLLTCFCSSVVWSFLAELSLQQFALYRCLFETLSKKVLWLLTPTVTTITNNRNNHLLILGIVGKHFLEPIAQVEKFVWARNSWFKDFSFNHCFSSLRSINRLAALLIFNIRKSFIEWARCHQCRITTSWWFCCLFHQFFSKLD